jgi:hypothetical protein
MDKGKYVEMAFGGLAGKTVARVRTLTNAELDDLLWHDGEIGTVIEFTDGSYAIVSKDDEGNGAGTLILGEYDGSLASTARQRIFGE